MPSFWPSGLELSDTATPMNILLDASNEWKINSEGLLELIAQTAQSKSGNDMIIVHAKHVPTNRTASILSIVMRPGLPYPVRIQPKENDMPDIFKKNYLRPSNPLGFTAAAQAAAKGLLNDIQSVEVNQWVAETPSEFRRKLADAFNLGVTKSIILNLVTSDECSEVDDSSELRSNETENAPETEDVSG